MRLIRMRSPFSIKGLNDLIKKLPNNIVMAEIGCYSGESAYTFLSSGKIKTFYAIDPWDLNIKKKVPLNENKLKEFKNAEMVFDERINPFNNVVKLKMTFEEAFNKLPELDFIYIDGDHRYEFVLSDIKLAKLKVKLGGIIAGHDYNDMDWPGVVKAVNESFDKNRLTIFKDSSWFIKI